MNLFEAAILAKRLMADHGLTDWSFRFDHARRRFGKCDYTNKSITLSRPLTLLNGVNEARDTILHEIAHALTPGAGHGARWRAACVAVGAKPSRCYKDADVVSPPRRPAAYRIGCPKCDWWVDRRRNTGKKYLCKRCGGPVSLQMRTAEA